MIIVLFGGPSDERHVSVASAQNIVRTLGTRCLAWFWAPDGPVHDVAPDDLLAHQRPFELDYVPSRPAIFPDLEQALDTLPVDDPIFLSALHGGTCSHFGLSTTVVVALRADATGRARAAGRLLFHGKQNIRLSVLTDADHVLVIVLAGHIVACGTFPRASARKP